MEKNRKKAEQLEAKKAAEQEAKSQAAALEEARKLKELVRMSTFVIFLTCMLRFKLVELAS